MSKKQVVQYSVGDKVQFESTGYVGYLNSQTLRRGWENRIYTVTSAKDFLYSLSDEKGIPTFGNVSHILLKPFITTILDLQTQIDILSYEYHDLLFDIDLGNADTADDIYDLVNIILTQRHVISLLTKDNLDFIKQIEGGSDDQNTDRSSKKTDIRIQINNS